MRDEDRNSQLNRLVSGGLSITLSNARNAGHNGIDIASYDGEPCYFSTLDDTEWITKNETDGRGVSWR